MRDFVMSLLLVAAGEGRTLPKRLEVIDNAALRYSIDLSAKLPGLLQLAVHDDVSLGGWLAGAKPVKGFFEFCGLILDALDQRVRGRHSALASRSSDAPSSYDHAVFLALGQTLFQAADVREGKLPPLNDALHRASQMSPVQMQQALIANYLGNLLQDYFEATQIRAEFPKLPDDTENTLRTDEAKALAEWVFELPRGGDQALSVAAVQEALREIIGRVWIAEKALDD